MPIELVKSTVLESHPHVPSPTSTSFVKTSHVFEKEYSIEHARMSKRGAALPTNVEGALSLH